MHTNKLKLFYTLMGLGHIEEAAAANMTHQRTSEGPSSALLPCKIINELLKVHLVGVKISGFITIRYCIDSLDNDTIFADIKSLPRYDFDSGACDRYETISYAHLTQPLTFTSTLL